MATEQILILKLLTDLKQPVQSFGELETRLKTLRRVLKNTPNEGTQAFDQLAQNISKKLNIDLDAAKGKIREFTRTATVEVQKGSEQLREYRRTLRTIAPAANSINALRQQVRSLAKEVDNLDRNTKEFADKNAELRKLNKTLIDIEKTTFRGGRNVGNYETAFRRLGGILSGIGAAFGVGFGIAGASRGLTTTISTYKDFDQQIRILQAVSRATREEIERLEEQAVSLGESTQFTATQVATLQTNLARLGFNTREIEQATGAVLNFSIATGESLAESGKVAGQTVRSFGLDASETTRVVDILTESFNSSALQLETYKEGYKLFVPIARALNIEIEEVTAALGLFADNGLEGTIATTSLATAFSRLTKPSKEITETLDRLGIEIFDSQGNFVGLAQTLINVEQGLEGLSNQQRLAAISTIFGQRAVKNFSSLLNAQKEVVTENGIEILKGGEALKAYTEQLEASGGAAKSASRIVADTLNQDLLKLRSAIEGAAIRFGQANDGELRDFIQFLTRAVPVLAENAGLILRMTAALALFIARARIAGTLTAAVAGAQRLYTIATSLLIARINVATIAQKRLNDAQKANVVGLVITGIYLAIEAYKKLTYEMSDNGKAQNRINQARKEAKRTIAAEVNELHLLRDIAKDETKSKEEREQAIKRLNEIIPDYLGNIDLENIKTVEGIGIIEDYIDALDKKAFAQALNSQRTELYEKLVSQETSTLKENVKWYDYLTAGIKGYGSAAGIANELVEKSIKNKNKETESLKAQLRILDNFIKTKLSDGTIGINDLFGTVDDEVQTTNGNKRLDAEKTRLQLLQKEQKELAEAIKNLILAGEPYESQLQRFLTITKQLTDVQDEFNAATDRTALLFDADSLELYSKRIKELQDDQVGLSLTSDEYYFLQLQIEALEKQRANTIANLATRTEEYQKTLIKLNSSISNQDAELSIRRTTINNIQNVTSTGQKGIDEIKAIEEEQNRLLRELRQERLEEERDYLNDELELLKVQEQAELDRAKGNADQQADIRRRYAKERGEVSLDILENESQLLDIELERYKEAQKKKTEIARAEEEKRRQILQSAFQVANELNQAIFSILDSRLQEETRRREEALSREEELQLAQLDQIGASEEQKDEVRRRFEARREELEREAGRKAKRNALLQAAINIALGVTKALATLPPPGSFITAALVSALGAIQLATISAQRFALGGLFENAIRNRTEPRFGRGAYLKNGAYHSQGGMPIINPHTGQKVAEIEKDEGVINRRSMKSKDVLTVTGTPYEIASAINSYKGYGVAYPKQNSSGRFKLRQISKANKYRTGGKFGVSTRIPKMQAGGISAADISNAVIEVNAQNTDNRKLMLTLIEEVRDLRQSNANAIKEIPSTAEELERASQLRIDEQNAS